MTSTLFVDAAKRRILSALSRSGRPVVSSAAGLLLGTDAGPLSLSLLAGPVDSGSVSRSQHRKFVLEERVAKRLK
jgi:hypothetical protein